MRFLVLNLLLIGQLSSAHLSSATDGPRKLKLSTASKDLKIEAVQRTRTPTSPPTGSPESIDESNGTPDEPIGTPENSVYESYETPVEGNVGESPEGSTNDEMSQSSGQADSNGESNETVYPTLGNGTYPTLGSETNYPTLGNSSYSATSGTASYNATSSTAEESNGDKDEKVEDEKVKDEKDEGEKEKAAEAKAEEDKEVADKDEKNEDPATSNDV